MKLVELNTYNLGVWLSPTGSWERVGANHVNDIILNPDKFEITKSVVSGLYQKHNEPVGVEGRAREDLIALVLRKGWVRIRKYRDHWSITVFEPSTNVVNNIRDWLELFMNQGWIGPYEKVNVLDMNTDQLQKHHAIDIVEKHALEEIHDQPNHIDQLPNQPPILSEQDWNLYSALITEESVVVFMNQSKLVVSSQDLALLENRLNNTQPYAIKPKGIASLVDLIDSSGQTVGSCHRANLSKIQQHCAKSLNSNQI